MRTRIKDTELYYEKHQDEYTVDFTIYNGEDSDEMLAILRKTIYIEDGYEFYNDNVEVIDGSEEYLKYTGELD